MCVCVFPTKKFSAFHDISRRLVSTTGILGKIWGNNNIILSPTLFILPLNFYPFHLQSCRLVISFAFKESERLCILFVQGKTPDATLSLLMLNFFQACEWIFNHGKYTRFSGTQSHYYWTHYRSTIDLSRCNRQPRFQSDITLQRSGTDQQSRHRQRIIVVANRCYKIDA